MKRKWALIPFLFVALSFATLLVNGGFRHLSIFSSDEIEKVDHQEAKLLRYTQILGIEHNVHNMQPTSICKRVEPQEEGEFSGTLCRFDFPFLFFTLDETSSF